MALKQNSYYCSRLIFAACLFSFLFHTARATDSDKSLRLDQMLLKFGTHFKLHFTFEGLSKVPEFDKQIKIQDFKDEMDFIAFTKANLANYTAVQDLSDARIIHFVQTELLHQDSYVLNRAVHNINFNGTLIDFVSYLGGQSNMLSYSNYFVFGGGPVVLDAYMKVNVNGSYASVRDAFSSCFPDRYCVLQWYSIRDIATGRVSIHAPATH